MFVPFTVSRRLKRTSLLQAAGRRGRWLAASPVAEEAPALSIVPAGRRRSTAGHRRRRRLGDVVGGRRRRRSAWPEAVRCLDLPSAAWALAVKGQRLWSLGLQPP